MWYVTKEKDAQDVRRRAGHRISIAGRRVVGLVAKLGVPRHTAANAGTAAMSTTKQTPLNTVLLG
jgi:hypothetical protein